MKNSRYDGEVEEKETAAFFSSIPLHSVRHIVTGYEFN